MQVISATFEDGVLKPDQQLNLPPHTRVRLVIEPLQEDTARLRQRAWETIEQLWQQSALNSQGERLDREQLQERR